jgi:hypothetical protein
VKYKREDRVIVYENTPFFRYGGVAIVIDRDPIDNTYAVVSLEDAVKGKFNVEKFQKSLQWVKETQVELIAIYEPKSRVSIYLKRVREWIVRLREKLFKQ